MKLFLQFYNMLVNRFSAKGVITLLAGVLMLFATQTTFAQSNKEVTAKKVVVASDSQCNQFDVSLEVTGVPPTQPVEVVLVIDRSLSMVWSGQVPSALDYVKQGAKDFVDNLFNPANNPTGRNKVAIVSYSNDARTDINLVDSSQKQNVINAINAITAYQYTNIEQGYARARGILQSQGNFSCETAHSIVLMTDGVPTVRGSGSNANRCETNPTTNGNACQVAAINAGMAAKDINGNKISLFNIGVFGDIASQGERNVAEHTLRAINPDGLFIEEDATGISQVYNQIFGKLTVAATQRSDNYFVVDNVASGFQIVPGSLNVSKGSVAVSGSKINWNVATLSKETIKLTYALTPASEAFCGANKAMAQYELHYKDARCVNQDRTLESNTRNVNVPCKPEITPSLAWVTCENKVTYDVAINNNGNPLTNNYSWKFFYNGNQVGTSNNKSGEFQFNYTAGGDFRAEVTYNGTYGNNGTCSIPTQSKTVNIPAPLAISATATDESRFDATDGTAKATASGGVGPYTYSWNGGAYSGADLANLDSGEYTVTATDKNGCVITTKVTVSYVNHLPVASNDDATVSKNTAINVDVIANDNFGNDGASNSPIVISQNASNGNAVVQDNGTATPTDDTILYIPNPTFTGVDYIKYKITDGNGDVSEATLAVTVSDVFVVPPGERGCDCAPLYEQPQFKNPTLISGSNLNVGAIYRFSNVFADSPAPIDALVKIVSFNNGASLLNIDVTGQGIENAFQPQINSTNNGDQSVEFEITFVTGGGTYGDEEIISFFGTPYDIDGDSVSTREYAELSLPDAYYQSANTLINIQQKSSSIRGTAVNASTAPNGDISTDPRYTYSNYWEGKSSLRYIIGKDQGNNDRYYSLTFANANYNDPDSHIITAPVICGNVSDDEGNGLAGVSISISGSDGSSSTLQTDANGNYRYVTAIPSAFVDVTYNISEADPSGYKSVSDVEGDLYDNLITRVVNLRSSCSNNFVDGIPPSYTISSVEVYEGENAVFEVKLSEVSWRDTEIVLTTANGTAIAGDDYNSLTQTITIPQGSTSAFVTVTTLEDIYTEGSENFTLNGTITTDNIANVNATGTGTILDDQGAGPELAIVGQTVEEGQIVEFTVSLSNPSYEAITVSLNTAEGTALDPEDYEGYTGGDITFAPGETEKKIQIQTKDDAIYEVPENFTLNGTVVSGTVSKDTASGTGIITDNDGSGPELAIVGQTVEEGQIVEFTVSLSNPSYEAITVSLNTAEGTALDPEDYEGYTGGDITFAPGETEKKIQIQTEDDTIYEVPENFTLNGTVVSGTVSKDTASGTGIITDNDGSGPELAIVGQTVEEGQIVEFTVSLSNPSYEAITVSLNTAEGTALDPEDYEGYTGGDITFAPGETEKKILIKTEDDTIYEVPENFTLNGTVVSGTVSKDTASGTGIITDNDGSGPELAIVGQTVEEGQIVEFTVSLSNPSYEAITVELNTAEGTALDPEDYEGYTGGDIIFAPGETEKKILIKTEDDTIYEVPENFTLNGTVVSGTVSKDTASGTGIITDNDGSGPELAIVGQTVEEGQIVEFTVSLSNPSYEAITVKLNTAEGTALDPEDYAGYTGGDIIFAPGETEKKIQIQTKDDAIYEVPENFTLNGTVVSGTVSKDTASGTGIITDNDGSGPELKIVGQTVEEGQIVEFTVSLSNPSYEAITVSLNTAEGTALDPEDYEGYTGGDITFAPGETEKKILIKTKDDAIYEVPENFTLNGTVVSGTVSKDTASGTGIITDNDGSGPELAIVGQTVEEGQIVEFTVSLSNPSYEAITVKLNTAEGTALDPEDYEGYTGGDIIFAPGETEKKIQIQTEDDAIYEVPENFTLNGTVVSGTVSKDTASGTGIITDNDGSGPELAIVGQTVVEGEFVEFTVSLSNPSYEAITVELNTAEGTALDPEDYAGYTGGDITFAPGETEKKIQIQTEDDAIYEVPENFTLNGTVVSGTVSKDTASGTGIITDNDGSGPELKIVGQTVEEGQIVEFTVSLSNPSYEAITVSLNTAEGTALDPEDYEGYTGGDITFAPGETEKKILIKTKDDAIYEVPENFTLNGTVVSGTVSKDTASGTGIITDNDGSGPELKIVGQTVEEGEFVEFTVSLSNPSYEAITVELNTAEGTALDPEDYAGYTGGDIIFAPGETEKKIQIQTKDDAIYEVPENFTLNGTVVSGTVSKDTASGTGIITDNDGSGPELAIVGQTVVEGEFVEFTVSLSNPSYEAITVELNTAEGTALDPEDYAGYTGGDIIFAPGETEKKILIKTEDDTIYEVPENFTLNGTVVSGTVSKDTASGTGIITDNDGSGPALTIVGETVNEGENVEFTVSLSNPSYEVITVRVSTQDDSAVMTEDYEAKNEVVTFNPGETVIKFIVPTANDDIPEPTEEFILNGVVESGSTSNTNASGIGTIIDEDGAIGLIKTGLFNDVNSDGYAQAGETITYSFSVTNTGSVVITGTVIDDARIGVSGLAITPASLAPGEVGTASAEYILTQADIDAGFVTNQALATGQDPEGKDVTDTSDDNSVLEDDDTTTDLPKDGAIGLIKEGTFNDTNADGYAQVGETITYSFSVTNTGNVTITGTVIDDARIGVSGLAITPASLAPGEVGTASAEYILTQADIDAGFVTNQALATGQDPEGKDVTDTSDDNSVLEDDDTTTDLPKDGAIGLIKEGTFNDTNADGYAQVGETITYSFSVTNTGNVTITGTVIDDARIGVSGLAITPASLAPGEVGTATAEYILTQADIDAGFVTNQALATGQDPEGKDVTDTSDDNSVLEDDDTTTDLPKDGAIGLIKEGTFNDTNADGYAQVGETITYSFSVTNTGNVTITGTVIDDARIGVSGLAITPASLAPGEVGTASAEYILTQADIDAGFVTNQALATGQDPEGKDVTDTSDDNSVLEDDDTTTDLPKDGAIGLIKEGTFNDTNADGYAQVGETITYNFSVTNTGNVTITGTVIDDARIGVSGLAITPASLAPGEVGTASAEYILTQADIDAGFVTNQALATGQDPEGKDVTDTSDDNSVLEDDDTTTDLPKDGAIGLIKEGTFNDTNADGYAQVGETITYNFSVTNTGNVTITGTVIDDARIGVSGLAITPASLAPGEVGTASAEYILTQADIDAGFVTNQALATGQDPEGKDVTDTSDDNSVLEDDDTTTDLPKDGAIGLIKEGTFNDTNADGYAQVGETITYSFSVTNTGNVTITGTVIDDARIGVSGLAITPASLAPGEVGTASAEYILTQADIDAGFVTNQALATGQDPEGKDVTDTSDDNSVLEDDDTTTDLPKDGAIGLIKEGTFNDTNADGYAQVGETITYNFSVTNTGNVTITGTVIDDARIGVSGLAITPASLAPGEVGTASAEYILTQADIDAGFVTNQALATGQDPEGKDVTDTSDDNSVLEDDDTTTDLPKDGAIGLIKEGTFNDTNADGYAQVGETITYSFSVTNTGNVTITGTVIDDARIGVSGLAITPASLAPGEVGTATAEYILTQADIDAGFVTNQALATGQDPEGKDVTDTSDDNSVLEDDDTTTDLPKDGAIGLIKEGTFNDTNADGYAQVGETITYNFSVTNTGNVTITGTVIDDARIGVSGLAITPASLAPGEVGTASAEYILTQADIDAGFVTNQALATGQDPEGKDVTDTSDDNSVLEDDDTTTDLPKDGAIGLIKEGTFNDTNADGYAQVGETITYNFSVTNTGNVTITGTVIDDARIGVSGLAITPASLAPGEVGTASAEYILTQADIDAGFVTNQALATGQDPEGKDVTDTSDDNSVLEDDDTTTDLPKDGAIGLIKEGTFNDTNADGYAQVGETITYNFSVTNTGNVTITGTVIDDARIGVSGLAITPASLAPGEVGTASAEYILTQADIDAGFVTNQALATGQDPEGKDVTDTSDDNSVLEDDYTTTDLPKDGAIGLIKEGTFNDTNADGYAQVGETITYNFSVTNTGNVTITGTVIDDARIGVSGLAITPASLAPGEVGTASAEYILTQADIDAGFVTNQALATGQDPEGKDVTDTSDDNSVLEDDDTTTDLPKDGAIGLIKEGTFNDTNADGYAQVGETITYNFSVTNTGNVTITGTVIDDARIGVSGLAITPASLAPGEVGTASAEYILTQADIDAGFVTNQALATGQDPEGKDVTDTSDDNSVLEDDDTTTDLPKDGAIGLIKEGTFNDTNADGYAQVGETITYNFSVTNTGNVTITGTVIDDARIGVSGLAITPASLAPGEVGTASAEYILTQADIDAGFVTNQALATGQDPEGKDVTDTSDDNSVLEDDDTTTDLPKDGAIGLIKEGTFNDTNADGYAQVGETITYNFSVTNTGNVTITGTVIDDARIGVSGLAITPASLAPGEVGTASAEYILTQADIDAGFVTNQALATGQDPEGKDVTDTSDDNSVLEDDDTTTDLPKDGAIGLIKEGTFNDTNADGYAQVGETITYNFSVTNTGNVTITGTVIDDARIGVSGLAITPASLAPGEVGTASAEYILTQADIDAGFVTNQALATGQDPEGKDVTDTSDDNSVLEDDDTTTDLPKDGAIGLIKEGTFNDTNADGYAQVGETITYSFSVTNTGNVTITGTVIDDARIGVSGLAITPASLAPGEVGTASAEYILTQADIDAGFVTNQALATGQDPEGKDVTDTSDDNSVLEDDDTTTDLPKDGAIGLIKEGTFNDTNADGYAQVGETITYSFSVTNTGNVTITGTVIDDARIGVLGLAITPASLAPGEVGTASAEYILTQADIDAGFVTNQALATGQDPEGKDVTDTSDDNSVLEDDDTTTDLPKDGAIGLIKEGTFNDTNADGYAQVGETITYSFSVTNTGNVTITGTVIDDARIGVSGLAITPASLAPGEVGTASAEYILTQADIDAGFVTNQALATGQDPEGKDVTDTSDDNSVLEDDDTTTDLPKDGAIGLIKEGTFNDTNADGYAQVGETITYNFSVTNTGNVTITGTVIDDARIGVSGLAITPASLAPGEVGTASAEYILTQADIDAGFVTNQALATGQDPEGKDVTDTSDDNSVLEDDYTTTDLPKDGAIGLIKEGTFNDTNADGYAQVGETITYSFSVTNTGNVTITGTVIDDARIGVSGLAITPASLAPGEVGTASAEYILTQADIDAGFVTNQALATGQDPEGKDVTDTSDDNSVLEDDDTTTDLPKDGAIGLIKEGTFNDTNADGYAQVGETITYSFSVTNTGNVTITGTVIDDARIGVLGLAITPASLAPGEVGTASAEYILTQADIDAGFVTNQALATGQDPEGKDVTDTSDDNSVLEDDDTTTDLPKDGAIGLIKEGTFNDTNADGYAQVGETITYSFSVTNTGNVTITGTVIDDARIGVSGLAITPASLAPGEVGTASAEYILTQADIDAGFVTNQALATGQDPEGKDVTDTSDDNSVLEDDDTTTDLPKDGAIGLIKEGTFNDTNADGYAQVGETITYNFSVTNTGNVTITGTVIDDARIGVSGLAITPASLAPGEVGTASAEYILTQADIDAGFVTNQALATGQDPEGKDVTDTSDDNSVLEDDYTTTDLPKDGAIGLIKEGTFNDTNADGYAQVGETITYSFSVTNTGNVTITGTVIDDARIGVSGLAITPASLAPGEVGTASAEYILTQADIDAGFVTNQALATGQDPEGEDVTDTSDDNSNLEDDDTVTDLPNEGVIGLVKTGVFGDANGDGLAQPGETITYTFTVTNTGNVTITGTVIDDARIGVADLAITPASLAPGEIGTATAEYVITQADIDAGFVTNQALATGQDPEGKDVTDTSDDNSVLEDDDTTTDLPKDGAIGLIKEGTFNDTNADGYAQVGETITYSFSVTNTGNVTITGTVIDDARIGVSGLAITPASLAPGEVGTASAEYVITQADIDAGFVSNQALATGQDPEGEDVTDTSDDNSNLEDDDTVTDLPNEGVIGLVKTGVFGDANGDGLAQPGETITYTFTVTNTGNVTITGTVIDDARIGVADLAITPASLAPGEIGTATAEYVITQADIDAGFVSNQALATGQDPEGEDVTDTSDDNSNLEDDDTVTDLPNEGVIGLVKTGVFGDANGDGLAQPGETITYTFTVTNTGNVTITGTVIDDARIGVADLAITPASLAPGEVGTATAEYVITQADIDAGFVSNQALATGQDPEGEDVTDTSDDNSNLEDDDTVTDLPNEGVIGLVKTGVFGDTNGDGLAQPGETITYTFTVTNTGNVTITGTVIDDARIGVSGLAITPASLAPGEVGTATAEYVITQEDLDAGFVTNQALATGQDPEGEDVTDTSDDNSNLEDDDTVTDLPNEGVIGLVKTGVFGDTNGDGLAQPGETITYTFTVTNTGNVTITGTVIDDARIGVSGLAITPASLAPGEVGTASAEYVITQADIDAGFVSNQALATGQDPEGEDVTDTSDDNSNLEDDDTVTDLPNEGVIGLVKTGVFGDANGDGLAQPGETITYTFTVTNTGNVTITGTVIDDARIGVADLAITPASLAPGEIGTATAEYVITQADIDAGFVSNQALATGQDPEGEDVTDTSDDNSNLEDDDTVTDLPNEGVIGLVKTGVFGDANGDGLAQPGETITYTFTVTNTGNVTITGTVIDDARIGVADLAITPASLAPGEVGTATAEYVITQADIDAGFVSNQALATGQDPEGEDVTDTSDDNSNLEDDDTVTDLPNEGVIGLVKTGVFGDTNGDGLAQPGETITYTFTVTNTGNVTITGTVIDDARIGVSGLAITPASLAPGEVGTATAEYVITQEDLDAGFVTNQALATGQDPQGEDVTDTSDDNSDLEDDETVTELPIKGTISLIKTSIFNDESADGYAQPGETITYNFVVTNTGNVTVSNITVDDDVLGVTDLAIEPGTLLPGESGVATATYVVTQDDINAGFVINTALATGQDPAGEDVTDVSDNGEETVDDDGDGDPTNDPTVTDVTGYAELTLLKSGVWNDEDGDGLPEEGESISYTFTVTNIGEVNLYDIVIEDPLVAVMGGPIDLAPGESDSTTFTATYYITEDDLINAKVTNQALVSGVNEAGDIFDDLSDDPNDPTDADVENDDEPDDVTVVELQGVANIEDIIIHNIMTPNGDGLNDIFMIENIENFPNNVVKIFNRWGVEVYSTKSYDPTGDNVFRGFSDGRATVRRGEKLPTGTYYYLVSYERSAGEVRELSGFLYIN